MTRFSLGINTCFAVKRWPEPRMWAHVVADDLGLDMVQHTLDLVDLDADVDLHVQCGELCAVLSDVGITMHSTFTGLAAYSSNLLLHPDEAARDRAEQWYARAVEFTALVGGRATGGHLGAHSVSDWKNPARRQELAADLAGRLDRLTGRARGAGLSELYVENMASRREPSSMRDVEQLLRPGDSRHVPVVLCLDVGHQCVAGAGDDDRDPYAWLRRFGSRAPVVQLQQSDAAADHHWPFTDETNAAGRIDAERVLRAIEESGAEEVALVLEVIPPFEADDRQVVADLVASVSYWRAALNQVEPPVAAR